MNNIEYINDARALIGTEYEKEIQILGKREFQPPWDQNYNSPYYENILKIISTSINYITGQKQKVRICDKEKSGSLSMMTSTNITSTSTTEGNLIYINFQNKTKFSNSFYQMRENLQQKQENQMNQAFDQNHQTIIEFNTQ